MSTEYILNTISIDAIEHSTFKCLFPRVASPPRGEAMPRHEKAHSKSGGRYVHAERRRQAAVESRCCAIQ